MEIQHNLIIREARRREFRVTDLSAITGTMSVSIENHKKSEIIYEGTPLSLINLRSLTVFDNKQLTKVILGKLDIPFPKSILFRRPDEEQLHSFLMPGKKYVCKPVDMTEGIGVEMNFTTLNGIMDYYERNHNLSKIFMLEEQVQGFDLRAQVIGGRIVAACTREPAFVTGDGTHDLSTLIENRRKVIKSQNPMNDLVIDQPTMRLLEDQDLRLTDTPVKGRKVVLKELANMSQGARAIDVVKSLHPLYHQWVNRIVEHLNVDYFAVDFIVDSYSENPLNHGVILEINAKPEWLHHTFSEIRQHDIPGILLDALFS